MRFLFCKNIFGSVAKNLHAAHLMKYLSFLHQNPLNPRITHLLEWNGSKVLIQKSVLSMEEIMQKKNQVFLKLCMHNSNIFRDQLNNKMLRIQLKLSVF